MTKNLDVVAIGNAIVDVLSFAEDKVISELGVAKGTMMLIDEARAEELYGRMGQAHECSGGSAANTLAGMASLGAKTGFIGKVFKDQLGKIFRHDLTAIGVEFTTPEATAGKATARCLIFVTPDGQRTMNTYIGACNQVSESDVDEALIARAQVVYGEGYLWDEPAAKTAMRRCFEFAKKHGAKSAFTLSDVFCVDRHRAEFLELIAGHIDILFANEAEIHALYPDRSLDDIATELRKICEIAAITRSEKGSLIITASEKIEVAAEPISKLVDTTGAGDLYAAGFLYGYTKSMPLPKCGAIGSACAAEIIQQMGARPMKSLKPLAA